MRYLIFTLFLIINGSVFAQIPFFEKEFGDSTFINTGKSAIQVAGGSIFYSGYASDSTHRSFVQFHKLDENGNLVFSHYFSGPGTSAVMERMALIGENNFIIVGTAVDSFGNSQPMLMKVDSNGILLWQKLYSRANINSNLSGLSIDAVAGTILLSGFSSDTLFPYPGILSIKTDLDGNLINEHLYIDPDAIQNSDACKIDQDGYLFSGDKNVSPGLFSAYAIKTDTSGAFLWEAIIGSNRLNGGCKSICLDSNHDLIIVGEAATDSSANFDIQLSKLNATDGTVRWVKYIRATNLSDAGFSILETTDHYYVLAGYGFDTIANSKRMVVVMTDSSGNEIITKYFGSGSIDIGYSVEPALNNHFIFAGANFSNGKNILIYDEPRFWTSINEAVLPSSEIYPNPVHSGSTINWKNQCSEFFILNMEGKIVFKTTGSSQYYHFATRDLPCGTYFLIRSNLKYGSVDRFIIQ